ncbi:MAG: alanine racemase [Actinomycetaceae bacterium]|nr:alanine racemase [Actinomycetaceae bacterium]
MALMLSYYPARATIDLGALSHNLQRVRECAPGKKIMGIVKADAYGHGRAHVARTLIDEGVEYLGVAQLGEALALREEVGDGTHILSWVFSQGAPLEDAIKKNIDISLGAMWAIDDVCQAVKNVRHGGQVNACARVHIKVDTGMSRGGFSVEEFPEACEKIMRCVSEGVFHVVALWSHFARADEPESGTCEKQCAIFDAAYEQACNMGLDIPMRHISASGGILWHPYAHYDMVRPGIMLYGLSPSPDIATASELNLRAVMTLSADVMNERIIEGGTGVSYGHTEHVGENTRVGVVPLGYADGISRLASSVAPVSINGKRTRIVGRVCMDQCIVELPEDVHPGDKAVLFGDAHDNVPTADEWGSVTQTIGYEVVTTLGARVPRVYVDRKETNV